MSEAQLIVCSTRSTLWRSRFSLAGCWDGGDFKAGRRIWLLVVRAAFVWQICTFPQQYEWSQCMLKCLLQYTETSPSPSVVRWQLHFLWTTTVAPSARLPGCKKTSICSFCIISKWLEQVSLSSQVLNVQLGREGTFNVSSRKRRKWKRCKSFQI